MLILFGLIPFAEFIPFTNFTSGDDKAGGNTQTKSTPDRYAPCLSSVFQFVFRDEKQKEFSHRTFKKLKLLWSYHN